MDGIYANEWYNGEKAKAQEYIYNKKSILLGMPRLRQLRVKKGKTLLNFIEVVEEFYFIKHLMTELN